MRYESSFKEVLDFAGLCVVMAFIALGVML